MVLLSPDGKERVNWDIIIRQSNSADFEKKVNRKYEELYEYLIRHGHDHVRSSSTG